ncbi:MAG TPA: Dabb family protein [Flavihumibacter sp.]|nr:Dabb family protein [Bacteroidota bacterium]HOA39037.1 Dabb family protein [Flavihumibacter sp.]HPZ87925.1 Dabb family protein [Flavihumibacter sp.]HQD08979.1 Dabb family protein [Flavihumibacter sp.]
MRKSNRRQFITETGKVAVMGGLGTITNTMGENPLKKKFIHHVFFWLKNPNSEADKQKLIEGLQTLTKIKGIRAFQIGVPANTNREVIERSYAVSELFVFDNPEDQAAYQNDPIHLKFVENCSALWEKVTVFDTVEV